MIELLLLGQLNGKYELSGSVASMGRPVSGATSATRHRQVVISYRCGDCGARATGWPGRYCERCSHALCADCLVICRVGGVGRALCRECAG